METKKDQVDIRKFQEVYFNHEKYREMQLDHIEKIKRGEVAGSTYVELVKETK